MNRTLPNARSAGLTSESALTRGRALLLVLLGWNFLWIQLSGAQDTDEYYRQNCFSCHTIGGTTPMTGPDLKGLFERQPDREWLVEFMLNPAGMIDRDPYAKKIFEESGGKVIMPPVRPPNARDRANKLLDLIEEESGKESSQFKGLDISTAPFTASDRDVGRDLFLGRQSLEGGGAACIACHSMHDLPALGGGQLGPDLTNIYEERGRSALSAWLTAPGTPTMQPIYKEHPLTKDEIHALAAYFESSAGEKPAEPSSSRVAFLLMSLLLAAALVFALDAIWKRRFQAVRKPLVDDSP